MSTAARKARKKAGVQFVHPVKVKTTVIKPPRRFKYFEYIKSKADGYKRARL